MTHEVITQEQGDIPSSDFSRSGGMVLERYDDGRPRLWHCGRDTQGQRLDPPEVERQQALHRLNAQGRWEGVNPSQEDLAEIALWRSDWAHWV